MMSCETQAANPRLIVTIVVGVIAMCGECWLAWLPKVCTTNFQYNLQIVKSSRFCKYGVGGIRNVSRTHCLGGRLNANVLYM